MGQELFRSGRGTNGRGAGPSGRVQSPLRSGPPPPPGRGHTSTGRRNSPPRFQSPRGRTQPRPDNVRRRRASDVVARSQEDSSKRARRLWRVIKHQLVDFHALPEYLRDNEFIHRHYRVHWPLRQSALSMFSIHNETLNIWTHLVGFWLFLWLTIYTLWKLPGIVDQLPSTVHLQKLAAGFMPKFYYFLPQMLSSCINPEAPDRPELCVLLLQGCSLEYPNSTSNALTHGIGDSIRENVANMMTSHKPTARWPFFTFLAGAMFCLLASTTCHLFSCISPHMSYTLLRIDYAGIVGLIAASFYPSVYYGFMCNTRLRNMYLVSITVIGVLTIVVTMQPVFQTVRFRSFRAGIFFGMGVSGVVPCVHKLFLHPEEPGAIKTLTLEVFMGFLYAVGALVYATRIPERWKPGRFDVAGNSHQIFHVLVVAGAYVHYQAGLIYLKWRDAKGCEPPY